MPENQLIAWQRAALTPQAFLAALAAGVRDGTCVPGMWKDQHLHPALHRTDRPCYCARWDWEPDRMQWN